MGLTTAPGLDQANSKYFNLTREDLMDFIDRVDPYMTPAYSMAQSEEELGEVLFQWEVDNWPNPNGAWGPGDGYAVVITGGSDETRDVSTNMRKMGNGGQAFRRVYGTGWIANKVSKLPQLGKGKILARGASDAMILIKQDIEAAFTSFDQTFELDQGGATGGVMSGIPVLINQANSYAGPSTFAYGVPTDIQYAPTAAVVTGAMNTVFTLTLVRNMLLALRQSVRRKKDYVLLCGLGLRGAVTGLIDPQTIQVAAGGVAATQVRNFHQTLDDSTFGITIDVIKTDQGRFLVMDTDIIGKTLVNSSGVTQSDANRTNRTAYNFPNYGIIISREKLFKRWGQTPERDRLYNDGGGTREQVRAYCSVGVKNPQGFGSLQLT